jgi:hypothetical protein
MRNKVLFLAFCLTVISFSANAQFKFGLTVGAPFKLNSFDIKDAKIENSRPFNIGLVSEAMVPIIDLGVEVSALYEMEKISGDNIVSAVNIGYLVVPVNLKWKLGIKPIKFFVEAGPSLQLMLHNSGNVQLAGTTVGSYKPEVFNWGLNAGAGLELISRIQLGVSYFYNFKSPFTEIANDVETDKVKMDKQGGFVVSLTYLF